MAAEFSRRTEKVTEVTDLLGQYVAAGGRDWETYERLLSGVSREGMGLLQYALGAWFPDMPTRALAGLERAAAEVPGPGGLRGAVHQQAALGLLLRSG